MLPLGCDVTLVSVTDGPTAAQINLQCTIAGGEMHNLQAVKSGSVHRLISVPVVNTLCHSLAAIFRSCNSIRAADIAHRIC
jgi:hypothetical protein